jgi:DeoR/GlpR family transcriptional regulator of sugar metabolism
MAGVSREVIVMVGSDKIGRKILNLELPWKEVDVLVTDSQVDPESVAVIESHGVKVIQVS